MELRRRHSLCLGVCLLFSALYLRADVTGSISGYIRDKSGAVLADASVTAIHGGTGYTRVAKTDAAGQYNLLALPPGHYSLTATSPHFEKQVIQDVDLTVNDALHFDFALKVGSVTESVEVQADAQQVQTSSTQLGTTIESPQILALPLNGRSYLDLLSLQAGVSPH